MKRLLFAVIALLIALIPTVNTVRAEEVSFVSPDEIDALTSRICTELKDRTSFTDACKTSADAIAMLINDGNERFTAEVKPFTREISVQSGLSYERKSVTSYNVIAYERNADVNKKTVLIAANFSNHYSESGLGRGVEAEGALGTAATTALAIELCRVISKLDTPYNFEFAFFSGTDEGNYGSDEYRKSEDLSDIMLVVNLERLGCGNTYIYTDEMTTPLSEFVSKMENAPTPFPQKGRVLFDTQTVDDLPYSHYAILGDTATFMSAGKSCIELIGGTVSGLKLTEGSKTDVINSDADTYERLVADHPNYDEKLAAAGEFIIDLTSKPELASVCTGAASSYRIFTRGWVAYVIDLGIIVILILIMILVLHIFEKKYPVPTAPRVKIAVFGKEYEDMGDSDIIVDLKHNDDFKDGDDSGPFGNN